MSENGDAEAVLRRRARRALTADDPAAQRWLATAALHPDAAVRRAVEQAQQGEVSLAIVVDAADLADRQARRNAELRELVTTLSREEQRALLSRAGVEVPDVTHRRVVRIADLDVPNETRAALHVLGIDDTDELRVDLDEPLNSVEAEAEPGRARPR